MEMNKRMGDNINIPQMNGTILKLVELISSPMDTPEKQAAALRETAKLQLHIYLLQTQTFEALDKLQKTVNTLLLDKKTTTDKWVDRIAMPILLFVIMGLLWLVFSQYKQ